MKNIRNRTISSTGADRRGGGFPSPSSSVLHFPLTVAVVCLGITSAHGWGGEHHHITAAATAVLPPEDLAILAPEVPAMARVYCEFPDLNWSCYGEWGGGNADPALPRLPDTRREWDVSFYCGWDPVLRTGKGYPHRPPDSLTVAALYFGRTTDALKAGNLADAARIAGAMFHYIQDSGSFPHMQPIHRAFHTQKTDGIHIEGYTPRRLGSSPAEAATALVERVSGLVASSERRLAPLLAEAGVPLEEARALCARELVPDVVRRAVAKLREGKPADYEAAAIDCANECARVCADAIYTALALAPHPLPPSTPSRPGTNLVFNPSFETDDGDGTPDGWYVGWLDLADRSGRAEWYRAGTHWDKPVKTGGRSAMILWAPPKGLEWRQSWRRATPVEAGAVYRGTASVLTRAATGATWLALQFFDTAYLPMVDAKSEIVKADTGWRELSVDTPAPPGACWLRAVLHTEANDGAVWFDDIGIVKLAR